MNGQTSFTSDCWRQAKSKRVNSRITLAQALRSSDQTMEGVVVTKPRVPASFIYEFA